MAGIQLKFSSLGNAKLPNILAWQIADFSFEIKSFHEPLKESTRKIAKEIDHQFEVGGDPAWTKLSVNTVNKKKSKKILIDSGNLRKKATQLNTWTVTRTTASYNLPTSAAYGWFHQTGFRHGSSSFVGARPFIRNNKKIEDITKHEFNMWIAQRVARTLK